jgi:aldehyde dehydrogenase (NAD+)
MDTSFLKELGLQEKNPGTWTGLQSSDSGKYIESYSPVDGSLIGKVSVTTRDEYEKVIAAAQDAFKAWRKIPAPQRGEIIRQYGEKLRQHKDALGRLVSYEMGKSLQEGWGEVQEMIDICDFAVGLISPIVRTDSMHSERPNHRMYEQWHPLGIVGIISAFNFPVAVWSWNCHDCDWPSRRRLRIWKPSEKTPLCSVACQQILPKVC